MPITCAAPSEGVGGRPGTVNPHGSLLLLGMVIDDLLFSNQFSSDLKIQVESDFQKQNICKNQLINFDEYKRN
jgi:hypothetical protein